MRKRATEGIKTLPQPPKCPEKKIVVKIAKYMSVPQGKGIKKMKRSGCYRPGTKALWEIR